MFKLSSAAKPGGAADFLFCADTACGAGRAPKERHMRKSGARQPVRRHKIKPEGFSFFYICAILKVSHEF